MALPLVASLVRSAALGRMARRLIAPARARLPVPMQARRRLTIALPCHGEQAIVARSLTHFRALEHLFAGQIRVRYVTSAHEAPAADGPHEGRSTRDLLSQSLRAEEGDIALLHAPAGVRSKSDKLNHLLQGDQVLAPDDAWLVVFDADARPPSSLIAEMLTTDTAGADLCQTVPIYPVRSARSAAEVLPWLHSLAHFERNLLIEAGLGGRTGTRLIRPAMGNGLMIRTGALHRVGGFPAHNDDVALGYRLDWVGTPRRILRVPLVSPEPAAPRLLVSQFVRIFRAVYGMERERRAMLPTNPRPNPARAPHLRLLGSYLADGAPVLRIAGGLLLCLALAGPAPGVAVALLCGGLLGEALVSLTLLVLRIRLLEDTIAPPRLRDWLLAPFATLTEAAFRIAITATVWVERRRGAPVFAIHEKTPR
ncbi:hypothetical protein ACG74X_19570 [Marivita sp. S0852]|uniref:hypothetical protein n=1 Tax=Marivita sp. S0852 TaxID=3373893 RepID=UPI0039825F85